MTNHTVPTESELKAIWWRQYQRTNPTEAAFMRRERDTSGKSEMAAWVFEMGCEFTVTRVGK